MSIEFYNYWFALGTVLMQFVGVALLAVYFLQKRFPDLQDISALVGKWGVWLALLLVLGGTIGSLFYSEVLGILPCSLCWLQRVFLYPLVVLFAVGLIKKDKGVSCYAIPLAAIGGLIALYQHYLQMGGSSVLPCPATADQALDCGVRFVYEFGYMTFPLEAATIFGFLIVLMLFVRSERK